MQPENDLFCTVVSIVPFEIVEVKPGLYPNTYKIEAASEDEPKVLHIGTGSHNVYIDDSRGSLVVKDPSMEIARSVVDDFVSAQLEFGDGVGPGIFWVLGKLTASEVKVKHSGELTQAKIRQRLWFTKLIKMADRDWERYKMPSVISDFQRLAAQIMKVDVARHTWLEPSAHSGVELVPCIACFTLIHPQAILCANCKVIQKPDEAKKLQYANI